MKKLLIIIAWIASLNLAACSTSSLPWVHKINVQQGNVVTQEMVNKLKPGMTQAQARFIMGSPMVTDTFHQERWDYIYLFKPGYGSPKQERVSLYFEKDALTRITGTLHPEPLAADAAVETAQTTVVVPPYEQKEPGILSRFWRWITFRKQENP